MNETKTPIADALLEIHDVLKQQANALSIIGLLSVKQQAVIKLIAEALPDGEERQAAMEKLNEIDEMLARVSSGD